MKIQVILGAYRCTGNTLSYWKSSKVAHRPRQANHITDHVRTPDAPLTTSTCIPILPFILENKLSIELLLRQQCVQVQIVQKHSVGANKTPATSNKLSSGDSCNDFQKCHVLIRNINLLMKSFNTLGFSKAQLYLPK